MVDKERICFIRPKIDNNDYYFNAIVKMGFRIYVPYIGNWLIFRVIREIWFRMRLPFVSLWYNKRIKEEKADIFILRDSLLTNDFINWIRYFHPDARIIMDYDNLANTTIRPDQIQDQHVEKWSYDVNDCKKYGMKLKPHSFLDVYRIKDKREPKIDILYLGRDKGRLQSLLELEKKMKELGLRTYFHICADRRFLRVTNHKYKKLLSYYEYMDLMKESRAILNIVGSDQASMTMRDMEVVFNGIKGITNNKLALEFPLYDKSRFFVLGIDPIESLPFFLDSPFKQISDEELIPFCYENSIEYMITH